MAKGIEKNPIARNDIEIQSNRIIDEQKITSFFAFLAATTVTFIIGILLNFVPNVLDTEYIVNTYNIGIQYFVPEKSEKLQYIVCTISFPILYIFFHLWFNHYRIKSNASGINERLNFYKIVFVLYSVIILTYLYPCYFLPITLSVHWWIILMYTVVAMLLLITSIYTYEYVHDTRTSSTILFALILIIIFFVAKLYVTSSYFNNNTYISHHFNAYFYPIYKVYCGQTPLIDFNCIYGLYPYFLVPIFKMLGGITMYGFSLVIAGMAFITLTSIAATLFIICKNRVLAFWGSLAVVFTISILPMLYGSIYYLQYFPHRVFFPALLLLLCSILIKMRESSKCKYVEWIGFLCSGLAILWNIDTGLVVYISYCAFLLYIKLYTYSIMDKKLIKYTLYVITSAILVLIFAVIIICVITYLRTDKLLNLEDILYGQTRFYRDGFYMMRMPLLHPWLILIGIYSVGLVKAIRDISFVRSGEPNYTIIQSAFFFLIPVMGLGIFSYYQGRSHDLVLSAVLWPGVILLVLFTQEYAENIWPVLSKNPISVKNSIKGKAYPIIKFILSGLIISFIISSFAVNMLDNTRLTDAKAMVSKTVKDYKIDEALRLYDYYAIDGKSIDLIMEYSAPIYCLRNDTTIPNIPATVDLFTKVEYAQYITYLRTTNNIVIFDAKTLKLLEKYCTNEFKDSFLNRYSLQESSNLYIVYIAKCNL